MVGARSSSQLLTAVLHKLTHSWSHIGQIRMRILPEASVSAISPAFHLKARRVSYLRVSRLGVRLLFAFEPNRQTGSGPAAVQPRASVGRAPTLPVSSPVSSPNDLRRQPDC